MREVLAFGDGNNDAEMLSAVGVGVAMANARPAAKAAAAQTLAWEMTRPTRSSKS